MLSQLLFVRLRAAENALRDGRLDEAYRLAMAPDIREHRRGAAVLAKLTERFIERARNHFHEDRFTEALMDLDRAESGGVKKEEIAKLRENINTVATEQRRQEQSRRDRLKAAKRRIEGGSLVAGREILEQASKRDRDAQQMRREVDDRMADVKNIVAQAEKLISQGQLAAAAERVRKAKSVDAHNEMVTRVITRLCELVFDNTRQAVREGRLARATDELECLGKLGTDLPAYGELTDMLAIAQEATRALNAHAYADARRHAMSLARLLPKASWVEAAIEHLRQLEEVNAALFSGPLGERVAVGFRPNPDRVRIAGDPRGQPNPSDPERGLDDTVALPNRVRTHGPLMDKLILLVDGGGSYLIVRSPNASVGRVASGHPADIPIFSDVAERHANLNRVDDDYFLFSAKAVEVAGHKTKHHLLRDGDRIVLGRKAKFTFRLPSRKSPTAVLDLSDTTKMPNDVRRIVLFHKHATIGAGPNAHIRCQHAGTPLVLFERNGALWMRQRNNGHVDTEPIELPLGEPVELGGVSLVLGPWEMRSAGGRTI
ncbi:MAG: hypothetical protein PVI86_12250 [Phycisphaerae bacterium]|jgi:hypothetical protein